MSRTSRRWLTPAAAMVATAGVLAIPLSANGHASGDSRPRTQAASASPTEDSTDGAAKVEGRAWARELEQQHPREAFTCFAPDGSVLGVVLVDRAGSKQVDKRDACARGWKGGRP